MSIDWGCCSDVETVPGRMGGLPVVKHSRVLADTIQECAELGETPEEIAFDYSLPLETVREVLSYAAARAQAAPAL